MDLKTVVIGGKEYTIKQISEKSKQSWHGANNRARLYLAGEITKEELFQEEPLLTAKKQGGNAEWKALGNKDRGHNLDRRVGTWEAENIPPPTGYRKRKRNTVAAEQLENIPVDDRTFKINIPGWK